jgi:hypothetical protein
VFSHSLTLRVIATFGESCCLLESVAGGEAFEFLSGSEDGSVSGEIVTRAKPFGFSGKSLSLSARVKDAYCQTCHLFIPFGDETPVLQRFGLSH